MNANQEHSFAPAMLALAAETGSHEDLATALALGADPNRRSEDGKDFPLRLAARDGHARCCALLLDAGADPDARCGYQGLTPLHYAVNGASVSGHKFRDVCAILLDRGADPLAPGRDGRTPLDWARGAGLDDIADGMLAALSAREAKAIAALPAAQPKARSSGRSL